MFMLRLLLLVLFALTSGCTANRVMTARNGAVQRNAEVDNRYENLKRAARYPWLDDGRCAVKLASGDWAMLVERCYDALDLARIRFVNDKGACPLAQASPVSADDMTRMVGICLLVQPELAVAGVIVLGAIVVGAAIAAEMEATERASKSKKKWCDCYCGKDSTPVLTRTLDFECRAECVLRGHDPTDYVCR